MPYTKNDIAIGENEMAGGSSLWIGLGSMAISWKTMCEVREAMIELAKEKSLTLVNDDNNPCLVQEDGGDDMIFTWDIEEDYTGDDKQDYSA